MASSAIIVANNNRSSIDYFSLFYKKCFSQNSREEINNILSPFKSCPENYFSSNT